MNTAQLLTQRLHFDFGKINFSPSIVQAGAIVLLLFFLVLTLAQLRRHFVDWSFKGAVVGVFFGFLLALILEGFLVIGGKTAFIEVLGWKNPPKPIANALDLGRTKLIQVLGIKDEIPQSFAKTTVDAKMVIDILQTLSPNEVKKAKDIICNP